MVKWCNVPQPPILVSTVIPAITSHLPALHPPGFLPGWHGLHPKSIPLCTIVCFFTIRTAPNRVRPNQKAQLPVSPQPQQYASAPCHYRYTHHTQKLRPQDAVDYPFGQELAERPSYLQPVLAVLVRLDRRKAKSLRFCFSTKVFATRA